MQSPSIIGTQRCLSRLRCPISVVFLSRLVLVLKVVTLPGAIDFSSRATRVYFRLMPRRMFSCRPAIATRFGALFCTKEVTTYAGKARDKLWILLFSSNRLFAECFTVFRPTRNSNYKLTSFARISVLALNNGSKRSWLLRWMFRYERRNCFP